MFSSLDNKYDNKNFVLGSIIVFVFHILFASINRKFFLDPNLIDAVRASEDYWFQVGWLGLGHFILSIYFNIYFVKTYNGKGALEGLKLGILIGFLYFGCLLLTWSHFHIMENMSLLYYRLLVMAVILPTIDGFILTFIYKKKPKS